MIKQLHVWKDEKHYSPVTATIPLPKSAGSSTKYRGKVTGVIAAGSSNGIVVVTDHRYFVLDPALLDPALFGSGIVAVTGL